MSELSDSKLEIAVHSAPDLAENNYAPRWIEEEMDLTRFAGFDNQAGFGAQAFANQMMVNRASRQQRWNGDSIGINTPIR